MLTFEPYSLAALQRILPYLQKNGVPCSDLSAGSLFMWQEGTDLRFCEWNGTLVIRQDRGVQPAFTFPIGKDPDGMIDQLLLYVKESRLPLRFCAIDKATLEKIQNDPRLRAQTESFDPRWSDYVYSFEEAKTFSGKKYSGQRNHNNRFKKLYGEPDLRLLTKEDLPAVLSMLSEYKTEHTGANRLERMELESTKQLLSVYETLGLYAAGLFVEGKIAAFGIGEIAGDSFFIHVEKALRRFEGAYPTMYSGFVRLIDSLSDHPLRFVNREDDSGDPGIRTSKQQYHPIEMIDKYLVHIDSPAAKLQTIPTISAKGVVLTPFREGDKAAYRALCTDIQNNRYWGYDYREDASLTGEIDDDTFYMDTQFDMQVGDSINFAVRLCGDGEMIGEAILWNFNSPGEAELGCRILPQYQGNGYGKAAFSAAAEFAESALKLTVFARCAPQNTPSLHMIESSGFTVQRETEEYLYFARN